jgi:hypothetical protein
MTVFSEWVVSPGLDEKMMTTYLKKQTNAKVSPITLQIQIHPHSTEFIKH